LGDRRAPCKVAGELKYRTSISESTGDFMAKSIIEEILNNKEDLIIGFLKVMEGKEAKAKFNLDGIEFRLGDTNVEVSGAVELKVIPAAPARPKGKKR